MIASKSLLPNKAEKTICAVIGKTHSYLWEKFPPAAWMELYTHSVAQLKMFLHCI